MSTLTADIIRLRQDEHLTGEEIARRLGCSSAYVSHRLRDWAHAEPVAAEAAKAAMLKTLAGIRSNASRKAGATRKAMRRAPIALTPSGRPVGVNDHDLNGQGLPDPNRADRLLKRFSWQDLTADQIRAGALSCEVA